MKFKRTHIFPSTRELSLRDIEHDKMRAAISKPIKTWADKLLIVLDAIFQDVAKIRFNQSQSVDVADTGNADTEFAVAHNMGRIPAGYIVVKTSIAANVYTSTGGTAWSTTAIYLKADAANAAITVIVF